MNPLALACRDRRGLSIVSLVGLLVVIALSAFGCNKLKARDQLNKGVQAYKGAQYDAAIETFKQANDLDPGVLTARLYLVTAYYSQNIPGGQSVADALK